MASEIELTFSVEEEVADLIEWVDERTSRASQLRACDMHKEATDVLAECVAVLTKALLERSMVLEKPEDEELN